MTEKQNDEMVIDDFEYNVIEAYVVYLYWEELNLKDVEFALQLLSAADKYGALELKNKCEKFAINNLTEDKALKSINVGMLQKATNLFLVASHLSYTMKKKEVEKLRDW